MSKYEKARIFTLNEPKSLRINTALAEEIGLNESIILLQLEFLISISQHTYNGKKWTYQSGEEMHKKYFPFWSKATINRIIKDLLDEGYIVEDNFNKKKFDKTRWFALNFEKLKTLKSIAIFTPETDREDEPSTTQNEPCTTQNEPRATQNEPCRTQNESTIPDNTIDNINNNIYRVFDHYQKTFKGLYEIKKLSDSRKSKVRARLKTYTPDELIKAIDNIRKSDWHMGENPSSKFYATPEFIFRSDEMIEGWIQNKPQKQIGQQYDSSKQQGERDSNRYKKL